jgi:2-keto-4-pentenoate hydratase/2-oxohepta-3-ene-1,7-dioic acid hydratase in catechol pathway
MRLATFQLGSQVTWGVQREDRLLTAVQLGVADRWPTLLDVIRVGDDALAELGALARSAAGGDHGIPIAEVKLLAPVPVPPQNPVGVGLNYRSHVAEASGSTGIAHGPRHPMLFTKARTSVVGPGESIRIDPEVTTAVDWEVELTAVVGRGGRDIPADRALDRVFGYTIGNDVSARDLQFRDPASPQFHQGKSLDTFCPIGPCIVTRDELDPAELHLQLRVNGVVKQDASTAQMIFGVGEILAELSRCRTLEPGELVLTGTPAGVGFTREPPEYLQPGDVVEADIEGIGTLRNPVEGVGPRVERAADRHLAVQ